MSERVCHKCGRSVPSSNFELHSLRCRGGATPSNASPARTDSDAREDSQPAAWSSVADEEVEVPHGPSAPPEVSHNPHSSVALADVPDSWECRVCTYRNDPNNGACEMCGTEKGRLVPAQEEEPVPAPRPPVEEALLGPHAQVDEDDAFLPRSRPAARRPGSARNSDDSKQSTQLYETGERGNYAARRSGGSSVGVSAASGALAGALMGGLVGALNGDGAWAGAADGAMLGGTLGAFHGWRQDATQRNRPTATPSFMPTEFSGGSFTSVSVDGQGNTVRTIRDADGTVRVIRTSGNANGGLPFMFRGFPGMQRQNSDQYEALMQMFGDGTENMNRGVGAEVISSLPSRRLTKQDEMKLPQDAKSCTICMDEFSAGQDVKTLPCFHQFHDECIDKWIEQNGVCPVCKSRVDGQHDGAP